MLDFHLQVPETQKMIAHISFHLLLLRHSSLKHVSYFCEYLAQMRKRTFQETTVKFSR